jgi:hypothetical protein
MSSNNNTVKIIDYDNFDSTIMSTQIISNHPLDYITRCDLCGKTLPNFLPIQYFDSEECCKCDRIIVRNTDKR